MKVYTQDHGSEPIEVELGKHGFVRFTVAGHKIDIKMQGDTLCVRNEGFGVMKVLPRVANEVLIGIEK